MTDDLPPLHDIRPDAWPGEGKNEVPPMIDSVRLTRLLVILGVLMALLILPPLVKRIQYSSEYGKQRARMDIALEGLGNADLRSLSQVSRWVAHAAGPSVVNIRTTRAMDQRFAADQWPNLFGREEAQGQGSGVIVDAKGFVLTNNHVIQGAEEIEVQLSDGRLVAATVVGADDATDLAVLRIPQGDLVAASWGDSDALEPGDMIWALGSPFGYERSVTFGIVSATERPGIHRPFQDFLQTDAAVNPGNSGGPLVNMRAQVVGINTAIVGPAYRGISFAIPSRIARNVYAELREKGKIARGWMGVQLQELTPEIAVQFGLDDVHGVLVANVLKKSPAEKAGLENGDVIVQWNDAAVQDRSGLMHMVASTEIGSQAKVTLLRDGKPVTRGLVVGERPTGL